MTSSQDKNLKMKYYYLRDYFLNRNTYSQLFKFLAARISFNIIKESGFIIPKYLVFLN